MRASWTDTTLGAICDDGNGVIKTGPFGSQLHKSDYTDEGVPVVMPTNIDEGRVSLNGIARIGEDNVARLAKHKLSPGDIVYGRRGDIGRQALITKRENGWLCGTGCLRISLGDGIVYPVFLHYYLRDEDVIRHISNQAVGATMPNLNTKILRSIPVRHPDLPTQRKIAGILSAYDDLIENNLRRIKILEQMAQSLYREWFVHFRFPRDPSEASAKAGGHESATFKDSKLGRIPEGWEWKHLEEIAEFRLGKMLDKKKNKGDLMPYLANVNVRWGKIDLGGLRTMRFKSNELETYGLNYGDIVMCEGGEPGRCAVWRDQMQGMMIQKAIHRIRSRENMNCSFLYHSLRYRGQEGHLAAFFTGATIKHLPREKLAKVTLLVPPRVFLDTFDRYVEPIENQISMLETSSNNLRRTRDLLLPKLLS